MPILARAVPPDARWDDTNNGRSRAGTGFVRLRRMGDAVPGSGGANVTSRIIRNIGNPIQDTPRLPG
jgi:hypothetical protein